MMTIWTAEIKELEKLYDSFKGNLPDLEKELEQLIRTQDANVVMLYSRRCLEVIITDLCECELKRPRKTEPLKGIIDRLNSEGKVPPHIITSMHGLNSLSIYGTHPKDFDPEQVKPVLNNLAVVIKWYFGYCELRKADGLKTKNVKTEFPIETPTKEEISKPAKKLSKAIIFLTIAIVAVSVLTIIYFSPNRKNDYAKLEKSIAVLPFDNLSNDPDQEYFSVGIVDEILDKLFKVGGLKVIARTSSARFINTNLSIKEIARKLGVANVIEGSVRKMGNNVRITVQLIDARTEAHLWSEIYEKDISNIFLIQSDVAQKVARELKAVIIPQTKQLIEKKPTTNMAAYEAYWRGMLYHRKLNRDDLEIALKYFELAKEKDTGFALAYAGIGRVWRGLQQISVVKVSEGAPKEEAAVIKAMELDSTSSEVHHLMGGIRTWTKWDWKGGEASYRKAIELNPQNADAHSAYSHLLNVLGRPDEAMKHIEIALDLDPINSKVLSFYGVDLMFVRKYDEAIKTFQKAQDLDPRQGLVINIIPALHFAGRDLEATEMMKKFWNDSVSLSAINEGYKERGFRGAEKKLADILAERSKTKYVAPYGVAFQYALAGDTDKAILWLEKAYEEHSANLPYLLSPAFDILRDHPRFKEIARRMNLPYK
jgi:adenylate cyclase